MNRINTIIKLLKLFSALETYLVSNNRRIQTIPHCAKEGHNITCNGLHLTVTVTSVIQAHTHCPQEARNDAQHLAVCNTLKPGVVRKGESKCTRHVAENKYNVCMQ